MDDRLGLNDAALESCASSCAGASEALAGPATAVAPSLLGVTDLGGRVAEFMAALALACGVLGGSADAIAANAKACKRGSDALDVETAMAAGGGAAHG